MLKALLITSITIGVLMSSVLPKYYSIKLDNGLEVVAIPMQNGSNVITTDIFYKVGSRNEKMGKSGIAHMLEHLNFKSTKNLKAGEFDERVKEYGGITNASTGFDYTHYFIKSSSDNLDKSLELFAELMQNLALKDEEFQPERNVVAEERRWRTDNNNMGYLYFRLFNSAFVYHPYHWTPIGFMDDILNWKIEDIKEFHRIYYQPKNAIIIVAGDIDKERVFEATKKYFNEIKNCCEIPEIFTKEPEQDGPRSVVVYKDSEVEMLAIAYKIPNFEHQDQVVLSALADLLANGKSSRLYKSLVDNKRLANQIAAYNMELKDEGVFIIFGVCNQGVKAERLKEEILKELESIKDGKLKDSEIEKVKINTKADFIFSLENSSTVADLFGSYLARGNIKPLLEYEENINKLDTKSVIEVAKKYFIDQKSTTVILKKQN